VQMAPAAVAAEEVERPLAHAEGGGVGFAEQRSPSPTLALAFRYPPPPSNASRR
jgi:hypothetical protein